MSYAIRIDGLGWRACSGKADVGDDEIYSKNEPTLSAGPQAPQVVTALSALLALDAAGLSGAYQAWADSPERTFAERAFIAKALTWERQSPVTLSAIEALGITQEQADELFTSADGLR